MEYMVEPEDYAWAVPKYWPCPLVYGTETICILNV
jgi:hypothetical protein